MHLIPVVLPNLLSAAVLFCLGSVLAKKSLSRSRNGSLLLVAIKWFEAETLGQKPLVPGALLVLVLIPFVRRLLDPIELDHLRDRCDGHVCMQSTVST